MKLSNDEKTLMLVMALSAPDGAALPVAGCEEFFDRPCKLRKAIKSLERWGIITHDPFAAMLRLLVQPALRALSCGPAAAQPVLFPNERPLDAALAQTCSQPGPAAALAARPENAACVPEHAPCVPEHKIGVQNNSLPPAHINVRTFNRKNVLTNKRKTSAPDPENLRELVRAFVGETDYAGFWARAGFWTDPGRVEILAGTIRFLQAGLRAGDIHTKTTPGKHLWNQFRHDCRAKGMEANV
jgi:hypothetical protein